MQDGLETAHRCCDNCCTINGCGDMKSDPTKLLHLFESLCGSSSTAIQCGIADYLQKQVNAEKVLLLLVSSDHSEITYKACSDTILEEKVILAVQQNGLINALTEKRSLKLPDVREEGCKKLHEVLEMKITSLLCVPIPHPNDDDKHILLVCLINKNDSEDFSQEDETIVKECCRYISPLLMKTIAFEEEKRQRIQCQSLLNVAKNLFSRLDNVTLLLREIMAEARNLTNAERCSLFLLDQERKELVAKVFDCNSAEDGTESSADVRLPMDQGIAGHVATTGKLLNISDAYSHPLFYSKVDEDTGFKTRNILCFPILGETGTIGVAELCNKKNGSCFSHFDEEIAKAFSIYCAISIMHSLMWKKVRDAQHRSRLSNELMMYHMQVPNEEVQSLVDQEIPSPSEISPDFREFFYTPRSVHESDTSLVVVAMFHDLGMMQKWNIHKSTLARFILMVKKGYRDPPYHNWMHAFSVTHFCYLLIQNCNLMENYLTDLECFALLVACMCHDLDHRGTTNSFQLTSKSDLAGLYSSEGSVMERHHFAQAMAILNTDGCNIFENLSKKQYTNALDNLREIILATDLAHHLRTIKDIQNILKDGYDSANPEHHKLLLCLLVTSSDLSDQSKQWKSCKKVVERIYREFFSQGDLEKAMGVAPSEMMDRDKACIPELQINFLQTIVHPLYRLLVDFFPEASITVKTVENNIKYWEQLKDIAAQRESTLSLNIFDDESLDLLILRDLENNED